MASERFRINSPKVVHEIIDGEVVIVHLVKGHYYSLVKTGAEIWSGIERGISRSELVEEMVRRYDGEPADIEKAVNNMIEQLQEEELIAVAQTEEPDSATVAAGAIEAKANPEKLSFEPPKLDKYTDMEDLLLLDPIHEVDETGWPNVKPAAV
ncbi:PqqD family protein [Kamptonema formosum]|uniref:PqqD family protein n=1 Tax=Kamptonema formosum TaxID=331992 RepID=UPI00034AAEAE|nr:PqqD family protein [Oscillatoria sp. PCC 10802]